MWGSDFPHPEGTWPETERQMRETLHGVPDAELAAMLGGNAARVYDFEELRGGHDFLITMERVDGEPISRSLGGTRDWRRVVDRIVPVCRALSYIHSRRIVHYDVKPQNILFAADRAKLADFGVALADDADGLSELTAPGTAVGTLAYLAAMFFVVRPIIEKIARRYDRPMTSGMIALAFIGVLASALATEWIGIHAIFGAFLLGAIIPHDSRMASELTYKLEDFVTVLLLPAFFAFTGMRTRIDLAGVLRGRS